MLSSAEQSPRDNLREWTRSVTSGFGDRRVAGNGRKLNRDLTFAQRHYVSLLRRAESIG